MNPKKVNAFTLIELLTVIAIIGILAAIIIPVVGKVRQAARGAQCISNLRQIGTAMALHVEDHKGRLPGPFNTGQGNPNWASRTYTAVDPDGVSVDEDGKYFYTRLGPYVGIPPDGKKHRIPTIFICPGFLSGGDQEDGPSYLISAGIDAQKGSYMTPANGFVKNYEKPFGYPVAAGASPRPPMTLTELGTLPLPPSRIWGVADASVKDIPGGVGDAGWADRIPKYSPHGGHLANALFLDWHVGKINGQGVVR